MADVTLKVASAATKKFRDMGDGSHAEVVAAGTQPFQTSQVTISNGQSLSPAVDLGATRLFAILMPAGWDAAALTFQAGIDGAAFSNLYDDGGAEVSMQVAAARLVVIVNPGQWLGLRYLRIRSGASGAAVNQTADRLLTLIALP